MAKRIFVIIGVLVLASLADAATHIADCLQTIDGVTQAYGKIIVSGPSTSGAAGQSIVSSSKTVPIGAGGCVDFTLVGGPGYAYRALYYLQDALGKPTNSFEERWVVPDVPATLTIRQLWSGTTPSGFLVSMGQLNPAGFSEGSMVGFMGNGFGPVTLNTIGILPLSAVDTDPTMAANSDARVPSQRAVKAAIAAIGQIPTSTSQIAEGGNLYYTDARVLQVMNGRYQAPITIGTTAQYLRGDLSLATFPAIPTNTSQILESGNLYFTTSRVRDAMSGLYESPLAFSEPLSRATNTISIPAASSSQSGYLSSTDWSRFNAMQTTISGAPGTWPSVFPPSLHASTHAAAGSDPLSLSASQIGSGYLYSNLSGAPTTWAWGLLTGVPSTFAPSSHSLLSSAHGDTTAAAVARGAIITGQGATPTWSRLALGSSGSYLRSNGTDLLYSLIQVGDLPSGYAYSSLSGAPTIPTIGGSSLLKGSSGNAVAAGFADIFALFTGCSGTMYPGVDGSCHSSGSATPAGSSGDVQINSSGALGVAPLNVASDASLTSSRAVTWAAASAPTVNCGGTTTIDWGASNAASVVLTCNTALAMSNPHGSGLYLLRTTQNTTGGWSYTAFPGTARGLSQPDTGASVVTEQIITYDGTYYNGGPVGVPNSAWRGFSATESASCPSTAPSGVSLACADSTVGLKLGRNGGSLYKVLTAAGAGTDYVAPGGALGTPSSGDASNLTNIAVANAKPGSALPVANGGTGSPYFSVAGPTATRTYTFPDASATIPQVVASGSLVLATSAISSASCQTVTAGSVNSATATGVLTTDTIVFTASGSIKAITGYVPSTTGGLTIVAYPSAGYVNFDVCNWSANSITPGAVTVNWRVIR